GTVKGRLARARDLLRARLTRRGLALSTGLVAAALGQNTAPAAVPVLLGDATVRAAMRLAAGRGPAPAPAPGAGPTPAVPRGMGAARWRAVAAGLPALLLLALVAWLALRPGAGDNTRAENHPPAKPPGEEGKKEPNPAPPDDDRKKIQGSWKPTSVQIDG